MQVGRHIDLSCQVRGDHHGKRIGFSKCHSNLPDNGSCPEWLPPPGCPSSRFSKSSLSLKEKAFMGPHCLQHPFPSMVQKAQWDLTLVARVLYLTEQMEVYKHELLDCPIPGFLKGRGLKHPLPTPALTPTAWKQVFIP